MTFKNRAPRPPFNLAVKALLPAALLALNSCSSPPVVWNPKTSFAPSAYQTPADFGGEVVTDAVSTTATVVSVDHARRLVVLKRADGTTITYKALPGAPGFDVIQAGDQVRVSVAEELAVFLGRNSVPASGSVCRMARRPPPPKWARWCIPARLPRSMTGMTP
jgi:hypothetical protein